LAEIQPESETRKTERLLRHKYRADLIIIAPLRPRVTSHAVD